VPKDWENFAPVVANRLKGLDWVIEAEKNVVDVLGETGDVMQAVEAARRGCEATKGMEASLGRSVYVSVEGWNACPDPGAYGLVKLLEGFTG